MCRPCRLCRLCRVCLFHRPSGQKEGLGRSLCALRGVLLCAASRRTPSTRIKMRSAHRLSSDMRAPCAAIGNSMVVRTRPPLPLAACAPSRASPHHHLTLARLCVGVSQLVSPKAFCTFIRNMLLVGLSGRAPSQVWSCARCTAWRSDAMWPKQRSALDPVVGRMCSCRQSHCRWRAAPPQHTHRYARKRRAPARQSAQMSGTGMRIGS